MKIYNKKTLLIILILLAMPIFSGCSNQPEENEDQISDIIELTDDVIKNNKIETITVEEKPVTLTLATIGEIKRDENKYYTISSMVQGRIISTPVKLGDYVKEGQIVAYIQNPEITKINAETTSALHENRIAINQAKTRYNLAQKNYEREKTLYEAGISPKKDLIQAESDYLIAKDDLKNCKERDIHIKEEAAALMKSYGIKPDFDTENIKTANPITAMISGIITAKNATLGSIVTPEQILFEVTDLENLWLDIVLYPQDVSEVAKEQRVEFISDSYKDKIFTGKIDYIQPISNKDTQTFTARAFINNSDKLLQPGMYGTVKIFSDKQQNKPFVPETAIQKYGKETFVFIDAGNGKYEKRIIETKEQADNGYYVEKGVSKGDKIVTNGSFMLKSEMLKSEFAEED